MLIGLSREAQRQALTSLWEAPGLDSVPRCFCVILNANESCCGHWCAGKGQRLGGGKLKQKNSETVPWTRMRELEMVSEAVIVKSHSLDNFTLAKYRAPFDVCLNHP